MAVLSINREAREGEGAREIERERGSGRERDREREREKQKVGETSVIHWTRERRHPIQMSPPLHMPLQLPQSLGGPIF